MEVVAGLNKSEVIQLDYYHSLWPCHFHLEKKKKRKLNSLTVQVVLALLIRWISSEEKGEGLGRAQATDPVTAIQSRKKGCILNNR